MAKSEQAKREGGKKLQWFFFVVVIPIVFAITLALIITTLLGINVFQQAEKYANQVPGLSQLVSTEEEEAQQEETGQLEATIANNNAEIEQLEEQVQSKQTTIDDLQLQIESLEAELAESAEVEDEEQAAETSDTVTDLASSFQEMDPEQAAPIIENMTEGLAVEVLEQIASQERGDILGEMEPETAANLASSFLGAPQ